MGPKNGQFWAKNAFFCKNWYACKKVCLKSLKSGKCEAKSYSQQSNKSQKGWKTTFCYHKEFLQRSLLHLKTIITKVMMKWGLGDLE